MFPRRMPLREVRKMLVIYLQVCLNVTLEDVAVLGECCPSSRDSFLKSPCLCFYLRCYFITFVFDLFIFRP